MKNAMQIIRNKGLKVTPQRISIYNILANTKSHPNAEAIYNKLIEENPTISLATVYKTLDTFVTSGLVQVLNVTNTCSNFDANTAPHPHIVCNKCNRIFDFEVDNLGEIRDLVSDKTDFVIESEQLIFYGVCPECQKSLTVKPID